ncbi:cytochrome-c peroxidase [Acidocella sp.]|uniref:cytochrome-c peroxidase n=1 Tax=Acidocella sp. TaxID=50710 RepID=UPI003CFEC8EE
MRVLTSLFFLCALGACVAVLLITRSPVPAGDWFTNPVASFELARGENPHPVHLVRPPVAPLSAMAQLGKQVFYDASLSSSGRLSCASCHSPRHFYGPPTDAPAVMGGPDLTSQGVRAVPSLMYLITQPNFSIGPDPAGDNDTAPVLPQLAAKATNSVRVTKTAQSTAQSAGNMVPQGGLFWDGRVDTLQQQAMGPLLSPFEMDGGSIAHVAAKLQAAPYAGQFTALFGAGILHEPGMLVSEAMFALARYQVEERSFHPFTSKYDAWLEGQARLTPAQMRGYILFNDPAKGDCAACHLDQPSPDGQPPLFTDHQYEALGVPRNPALKVNQNPAYFDEGICGPYRNDLAQETQYCGMFLTPTLRNVATREVFFHNGVYHSLADVLDFYDFRDTEPGRIYPKSASGKVETFDDLPRKFWKNIDVSDPPFDRHAGDPPALTPAEEQDIIAFLKTLTDGYKPAVKSRG